APAVVQSVTSGSGFQVSSRSITAMSVAVVSPSDPDVLPGPPNCAKPQLPRTSGSSGKPYPSPPTAGSSAGMVSVVRPSAPPAVSNAQWPAPISAGSPSGDQPVNPMEHA